MVVVLVVVASEVASEVEEAGVSAAIVEASAIAVVTEEEDEVAMEAVGVVSDTNPTDLHPKVLLQALEEVSVAREVVATVIVVIAVTVVTAVVVTAAEDLHTAAATPMATAVVVVEATVVGATDTATDLRATTALEAEATRTVIAISTDHLSDHTKVVADTMTPASRDATEMVTPASSHRGCFTGHSLAFPWTFRFPRWTKPPSLLVTTYLAAPSCSQGKMLLRSS